MIAISVWLSGIWQSPDKYVDFQVKGIATSKDNYLLNIDRHIRFAQRPVEEYPFPIPLGEVGPVDSLYSGNRQYPFYCMTMPSELGQPVVDNDQGLGVPVYQSETLKKHVIGYSKDCGLPSQLMYFTIDTDQKVEKVKANKLDIIRADQKLFRVEQGTINRFIYTIIVPINREEVGDRFAKSMWNHRLIYQFNGGSGIGYRQGKQRAQRVMQRQAQQLLDGYAVIASSGNRTSYTYNMLLAEDTARRVKQQFISLYGEPLYTVGIGGSGGGLAQYLIGQNSEGILDGLIPLYSYPDMITQTTYALDCDLLNNYFTFRAENRSAWNDWSRRQLIEGMNALNDFPQRVGYMQPVNQLMAGFIPSMPKGNSECINGYFGLSTFINNPRQGFLRSFFHPDVVEETKWSYWQDMKFLLGEDNKGYGLTTWDNVGVQYGLTALKDGQITVDEFLDINRKIGGWKSQHEMEAEDIATPFGSKLPIWLSLWGNQNITELNNGVAARHAGDISAMQAAYRWGQVFIGKVDLPILDVRHYLEDELDMHHMSASFYSRLRIEQANGHAKNHVIWVSHKDYTPLKEAFEVMDQWILNKVDNSLEGTIKAKPSTLTDQCFDSDGDVMASGMSVFNGQWNNKSDGACQKAYPMFSTSRIQAGGTWSGDIFKCKLIPIEAAIKRGVYGRLNVSSFKQELIAIFPDGVCDYSQSDRGRPLDL